MRGRSQGWRVPFASVALLLIAGCGVNTQFVYKPGTSSVGGAKLPVKVAVLPFKDGTEDFADRGSVFGSGHFNLAKSGVPLNMTAIPPEMWAKSFAEDLAASGSFQSIRFLYSSSEFVDEDFFVEGTVNKAYVGKNWKKGANMFAVSLRALTRSDKKPVWEKEVAKEWKTPINIFDGCGSGIQCSADKYKADMNRVMQEMFAEARADLVLTLASLSKGRAGEGRQDKESSTPQDPDSVERTIDKILRGK